MHNQSVDIQNKASAFVFDVQTLLRYEDFLPLVITMNAVESIVMAYKAKLGLRFDKEVAASLGLRGGTFSNYMSGHRRLPDIAMVKLASDGDLPLERVIAATNATFKNTPDEEREFWQQRLSACQRS